LLKNISLQAKLGLMVTPAALALGVLTFSTVQPRLRTQQQAEAANRNAAVALRGMQVLDELEVERAASTWFAGDANPTTARETMVKARGLVDSTFATMSADVAANDGETAGGDMLNISKQWGEIRTAVDAGGQAPKDVFTRYTVITDELLAFIDSTLSNAEVSRLAGVSSGLVSFLQAKDRVGRQMAEIGAPGATSSLSQLDALDVLTAQEAADVVAFKRHINPAISQRFDVLQSDPQVKEANGVIAQLRSTKGSVSASGTARLFALFNEKLASYDVVDDAAFEAYQAAATKAANDAKSEARLFGIIGVTALIGGTLASILLGRRLARRVRKISAQAEDIASRQLPSVLEALRNPNEQQLRDAVPTVESDSDDEIGSLARSFNAVLTTSVDASFAHSQRRASTITNMLVNLGRRNQAIIDRQLNVLDNLQASANDPALLKSLFEIDHAATVMRRNAENLVLLAGQHNVRGWTDPVSLNDVMRAAMSETRAIERVKVESSGITPMISGAHVVEMSHLFAELLENALAYSPPTATVTIRSDQFSNHQRVTIFDGGVGLSDEELAEANERLANPPDIDTLTTDRVGFHVVSRLARRIGVTVDLHHNPTGGLVCRILVPAALEASPDELANAAMNAPIVVPNTSSSIAPLQTVHAALAEAAERRAHMAAPVAMSDPNLAPRISPLARVGHEPIGWSAPNPGMRLAPDASPPLSPAAPPAAAEQSAPELEGLVARRPGAAFGRAQNNSVAAGAQRRLPDTNSNTPFDDPELDRHRHMQMSGFQKAVEQGRTADDNTNNGNTNNGNTNDQGNS
jgi:signal transduction histidine kinase